MDRQSTFLLALALLIAAAAFVAASGWLLFSRERRAPRQADPSRSRTGPADAAPPDATGPEASEIARARVQPLDPGSEA